MSTKKSYSLNRECTDSRGVVMNTSSLGAVIGFGTAFSSLIEPGTTPDVTWSLFQSLTLISFLGMGLGAGIGLAISAYFATFVVRKYTRRDVMATKNTIKDVDALPSSNKRKSLFEVGDVAYGT